MTDPVEEAGKVAHGLVDALKAQPMTLALVIFNLLFAILVFLGSKDFRANQLQLMSKMLEMASDSQELLAKCIVPPNERRGDLGSLDASSVKHLLPPPYSIVPGSQ